MAMFGRLLVLAFVLLAHVAAHPQQHSDTAPSVDELYNFDDIISSQARNFPSHPLARSVPSRILSASTITKLAPSTTTCDPTQSFAAECRTAADAAPYIDVSYWNYNISSFGAQAAILSIMLFESGNFSYSHSHFPAPGTSGKGTRNMQSPAYNIQYATWLAEHVINAGFTIQQVQQANSTGPDQVLELVNNDEWGFGSAAWFIYTQCSEDVKKGLDAGSQQGYESYLTECIGTTVTDERTAGWKAVIDLGHW